MDEWIEKMNHTSKGLMLHMSDLALLVYVC